jgi:glycosyltransferase involved in cell wall biosynthesis
MPGHGPSSITLSIIILTRNRKDEALRAIRSCLACSLPDETEFVIVDNASQDGTQEMVSQLLNQYPYEHRYLYLSENIGCAAGRNVGLRNAQGRYLFFLDDDAYIHEPKDHFFQKMMSAMETNAQIFSITTTIYDKRLDSKRPGVRAKNSKETGFHKVLTFHGGSSLIDASKLADRDQLFYDYQFRGMAELYPCLKNYFNHLFVYEMDDVLTIHEPSENSFFSRRMQIIYHYTGSAHVKLTFYPVITYPIIYAMFCLRIIKHLGMSGIADAFSKLAEINKNLVKETVSLQEFLRLFKEFGFVATF